MASFVDRLLGAARLSPATYEEVEADQSATGQAVLVVALAAIAAGIATLDQAGLEGIVVGTIGSLVAWFVWAYMVWLVGTRLLPEPATQADVGQVVRTTGFSAAPGLLLVLAIIPALAGVVGVATNIWMLVGMVIAVRQALDFQSTGRAVLVALLGFVAYVAVFVLVAVLFGVGAGLLEAIHPAPAPG
jgi:Yip1 domain